MADTGYHVVGEKDSEDAAAKATGDLQNGVSWPTRPPLDRVLNGEPAFSPRLQHRDERRLRFRQDDQRALESAARRLVQGMGEEGPAAERQRLFWEPRQEASSEAGGGDDDIHAARPRR